MATAAAAQAAATSLKFISLCCGITAVCSVITCVVCYGAAVYVYRGVLILIQFFISTELFFARNEFEDEK